MRFKISEIEANPFRHLDRYPIRRDKVEALRESMRSTTFWDNIVARVVDGHPEIAYGHHRLRALREEYDPTHEVELIVRDLDDTTMIQIMARENMEEWGTSFPVVMETIRAVVEAYGAGQIELSEPDSKVNIRHLRYAPSFGLGDASQAPGKHPYTLRTVADFLGWHEPSGDPSYKVEVALAALQFIEEGWISDDDFADLGTEQARAVTDQARRAKAEHAAQVKLQREAAARAEREAREAEDRLKKAEKERQRREEQLARAREDAERQRREQQAMKAREEAEKQKAIREQAERRRTAAEEQGRRAREQGYKQASKVARHVGQGLRSGRGYKDAAAIADEVNTRNEKREGPPPHIDDYAYKLAAKLNRILDPDLDDRAKELMVLIRFQPEMRSDSLRELVAVLDRIVERAGDYRKRLMAPSDSADVIDGEVVPEDIAQPALGSDQ